MISIRILSFSLAMLLAPLPSFASTSRFLVDWSGADFLNSAQAHGVITLDNALSQSPLAILTAGIEVTSFDLTISGASAGNGSFQITDFWGFSWDTAGATLDFSQELIGQATTSGGWGTNADGSTGDFNVLPLTAAAPVAAGFSFMIDTNSGFGGSQLKLVSFRPAPVPLPNAAWLFVSAIAGFMGLRKNSFA